MHNILPPCAAKKGEILPPFGKERIWQISPTRLLLVLAMGLALVTSATAAQDIMTLTLPAAEQLALQRHPLLAQSAAQIEEAQARARSTGQLPDPQARFGMQNVPVDSLALNRSEMSMVTFGVSQMFPPTGKRALLQQGAEQETAAVQTKDRDLRGRIRHEVHMAWLDFYYQERELAVVRASYEITDQIVQAARAQYRVGLAQEADVLKAQLERDDLRDREEAIQSARSMAQSRLARLIGMPAATLALPEELPAPPTVHTDEELMKTLPQHPQVATLDAQIRSAELDLAAARRDYYPEFGVEAMYGYRAARDVNGTKIPDMFSAGMVMSLPLWTSQRQDARAQERQARLLALRYKRDDLLLQLDQEARARYAEYTRIKSRLALVEHTLLPQAEQTVNALLAAYRTGKTDMGSVLRARQASLEYALRLWRLRVDVWIATAELNYLGTTVTETSNHEH